MQRPYPGSHRVGEELLRVGAGMGNGAGAVAAVPSTSRTSAASPPIPSASTWWMTSTSALPSPARPVTTVTDHNGRFNDSRWSTASRCNVQQRGLVAGRRTLPDVNVVLDAKARIVDPYRPTTAERRPKQPLTQSRHRPNPFVQHRAHRGRIWRTSQDKHRGYLHRRRPGLRHQFHQIVGAGALKRRHRHRLLHQRCCANCALRQGPTTH